MKTNEKITVKDILNLKYGDTVHYSVKHEFGTIEENTAEVVGVYATAKHGLKRVLLKARRDVDPYYSVDAEFLHDNVTDVKTNEMGHFIRDWEKEKLTIAANGLDSAQAEKEDMERIFESESLSPNKQKYYDINKLKVDHLVKC